MAKQIKAKCEFGVNSIMDSVMVPDGFARVCDGLDIRSGVARLWQLPSIHRQTDTAAPSHIWEYRGKWYESALHRTYHGEYLYGQESVYFTEEGPGHMEPQKIIDGIQVRLGIRRPIAQPMVSSSSSSIPGSPTASIFGAGGVPAGHASYRIAGMVGSSIMPPGDPIKISIATPSSVELHWGGVVGADGYAIFGRVNGSERLIIKLGNVLQWLDDGSIGEGSATAASYEISSSFQYVYTYFRRVSTVEDESGPSPVSLPSEPGMIPVVSRTPTLDGSYGDDSSSFSVSSYPMKAYKSPSYQISHALQREDGKLTTVTTSSPHGLAGTVYGRLYGSFTPWTITNVEHMAMNVPLALGTPGASIDSYPVGGTLAPGTYTYRLVAVRGSTTVAWPNPAQTLGNALTAVVPGGSGSVRIAINSFTPGTDSFILYRNGVSIAYVPTNVATFTDTGLPALSVGYPATAPVYPAANDTSTRCLFAPNQQFSAPAFGFPPYFIEEKCDIEMPLAVDFAPVPGDVISISGLSTLSELNGLATVSSFASGRATINKLVFPERDGLVDSTPGGTVLWRIGNGQYAGWRIYRVGDTAEFLRVAELPMDVMSFVDVVQTPDLGDAIPTAYVQNGANVVYDRAPDNLKRMVPHLGMRFGIVDDIVRWTPTGVPDAWPDVFSATFPSRPVALASFRGVLSVICEDGLYALVGNTPSTLSPAGPFSNLGCIAPFSVQASNRGLLWLGKSGIVISKDGVSAESLTYDRVPGRFFYAPSTAGIYDGIPVGYGWLLPSTQTVQFAESMREERIDASMFPVSEVSYDSPINAEITDIYSFYWDNRYALYYPTASEYARSACSVVDMASPGLPLTTIPIKPLSVHVSLGGDCFMLLVPRAITSVEITEPV